MTPGAPLIEWLQTHNETVKGIFITLVVIYILLVIFPPRNKKEKENDASER